MTPGRSAALAREVAPDMVSAGNERRAAELFLLNLEKWARREPLLNPHTA